MFCIIALVIFSIMGIFSATHRALALEALDCVLRKVTFRPCNVEFKEKAKTRLVGYLLARSALAARLFNKHFEIFSWVFFILMVVSTAWVIRGGYNYYYYGSCNGLNASGFCAFDPKGESNKVSQVITECTLEKPSTKDLSLNDVNLDLFPSKYVGAEDSLVFIGCYSCDFTRKTYPLIQRLLSENNVNYVFAHYPVKTETAYLSEIGYCAQKQDINKFWEFNDALFASSKEDLANQDYSYNLAANFGYDVPELKTCAESEETINAAQARIEELQKTHIFGTPLIFINGRAIVGPKPYRVYDLMLK